MTLGAPPGLRWARYTTRGTNGAALTMMTLRRAGCQQQHHHKPASMNNQQPHRHQHQHQHQLLQHLLLLACLLGRARRRVTVSKTRRQESFRQRPTEGRDFASMIALGSRVEDYGVRRRDKDAGLGVALRLSGQYRIRCAVKPENVRLVHALS